MLRPVPPETEIINHLDLVDQGELLTLVAEWEASEGDKVVVYPAGTVFILASEGCLVCLDDGEVWNADDVPPKFLLVADGAKFEYTAP